MNEKPHSAQIRDFMKLIMQSCHVNKLMYYLCVTVYNQQSDSKQKVTLVHRNYFIFGMKITEMGKYYWS